MSTKLRIVLAQINPTVGDIAGNLQKHIDAAATARDKLKADLIVFPELSLIGYPPEDLLLRKSFLQQADDALQQFIHVTQGIYCVVSHPHATNQGLYNACSIFYNGMILGRYAKQHLPNYGVFDECRYFVPGKTPCVVPVKNVPVGLVVCEDLWFPGPVQQATVQGARLIVSPNASPFETDKHTHRLAALAKRASLNNIPIAYINIVGGQDDIVFDGDSMIVDQNGNVAQSAGCFNENLLPVDITFDTTDTHIQTNTITTPSLEENVYQALVLGVRDYVNKNHCDGTLVAVSGGIDSALTLAIAADALGSDRVRAVYMPSQFSADISEQDAKQLANNLGVKLDIIPINSAYETFLTSLSPIFKDKKVDITEENIQARCRAVLLLALSNKFGHLILGTSNRSEMAVGYCTIYGDMVAGFAVLKDIPKTLIYKLANYRNRIKPVIPERTINRAPTAELSPNQLDEDTLPPYPLLDQILELYLNKQLGIEEICAHGFDYAIVAKVVSMIHKNEYKRRQAPVGPRINHTAFGKDRRYPITSGFKG